MIEGTSQPSYGSSFATPPVTEETRNYFFTGTGTYLDIFLEQLVRTDSVFVSDNIRLPTKTKNNPDMNTEHVRDLTQL